ncbi:MAG TPA: amidohydrolase family protein [Candidatus Eisenbacteria bacterium]|nr:amidohydrolase family protein [Candidatus Eisenbacteria bacterium]
MRRLILAISVLSLPSLADSRPQDPPARAALVLVNARIYPVSGPVIDSGSILIEDGKIKAVGKSISIPSDAKTLDLAGKVVIPGLIDTASGLFLSPDDASSGGSAEQDICDALDFFEDLAPKEALASGVTTVCVSPPSRGTLQGQSAVVRVSPGGAPNSRILKRAAALKMSLGLASGDTSTASQRYRDYAALKDALEGAKKYQETWDKYRKEFEEYEKKKKEWDAKKKAAPKKDDAKSDDSKKDDAKKEEPKKEEPKKEDPPKAPEPAADVAADPQETPKSGGSKSGASGDAEPKKPSKPRLDPRNEVLVRALDEKNPLTVRVEAHSVDCIELALRLAEEFKLKMVLDQATESPRVAEAIAKAKVAVAVGPVFRYGLPRVDYLSHSLDTAAKLAQAGVEVSIGTFPVGQAGHRGPGAGRFLMEAAAWASSRGLTREQALQAITINPARQLGLADQIGSIAPDRIADLVVLRGDPFDGGTTIDRTFAGGEEVWTAPEAPAKTADKAMAAADPTKEPPKGDMVLLRGGLIVPVTGSVLENGAILLAGGKIHSIASMIAPPEGATVIDLPKGSVVVPGFIDLHSHLASSFEADETTETVTPLVRAVEAFASTHPDARAAARSGVTLVALAPGNANLVGGRPGLVRLNGERLDRMVWKDAYGLKLSLGREPLRRDAEPTSRSGAVRMLREILADRGGETWKILIEKKEPALVHARLADDITRLAEIRQASGLRAIVVHGNEAAQAIDAIKASGMGVAFGPMTVSDKTEILATPGRLAQAGIPLALVTDAPATGEEHLRVMAALAVRHGLSLDDALRALTIGPATMLGIADQFGSLEPGKQADVVVYSGDPLSLASDIELVVIEGRIVHRKKSPAAKGEGK